MYVSFTVLLRWWVYWFNHHSIQTAVAPSMVKIMIKVKTMARTWSIFSGDMSVICIPERIEAIHTIANVKLKLMKVEAESIRNRIPKLVIIAGIMSSPIVLSYWYYSELCYKSQGIIDIVP